MSILSDKEIRELSTIPEFKTIRIDINEDTTPKITTGFSHQSEDLLDLDVVFNHISRYEEISDIERKEFENKLMIVPFINKQVKEADGKKIISYGLSSYGYDVRLSNKFKIFTNINSTTIDPLNFDEKTCIDFEGDVCIIPPNSYILGVTVEKFNIPRDVMVLCVGKSTYARCGAIVNVTPIEPGFDSSIVIEISNSTNLPLKIYANQGIAQFLFFKGDVPCEISYLDKKGKYLNQIGIQTAIV